MFSQKRIASILLVVLASILIDSAHAWPRRRRAGGYSSGTKQIPSKRDETSADHRSLKVYYDYNRANAPEVALADRIRVFLWVRDEEVLGTNEQIVAEVKITDLSDHEKTCVRYCPVSYTDEAQGESKIGVLDLTNENEESPIIEPAKVYRLFVNLHRKSDEYGKESALGRVPSPYYVATSGDTRLDRARQHIVMRTFKEFYYTERGWRSEERYSIDCYAFYMWATGSCTVGARNGRTILGRLFGGRVPYNSGSEIRELSKESGIHGDYVRIPGHSFMLLSYDPKSQFVWTMEGNFNSTIEIVNRSVSSGWTVGHLADQHIRPELFEPASVATSQDASPTTLTGHSPNEPSS